MPMFNQEHIPLISNTCFGETLKIILLRYESLLNKHTSNIAAGAALGPFGGSNPLSSKIYPFKILLKLL